MDQSWAEYFQNILPMREEMRAMSCQQATKTAAAEHLKMATASEQRLDRREENS